jgi:AbrB family looped-hinge helix DNA binding protein
MLTSKTIGTVTQKGQVTIPLAVREHLSIMPNDKVAFEIRGEEVVLKKPSSLNLDDVFGAVTPHNRPEDFNALRDVAMEAHIERSKTLKP